jgi:hypothetical protein
LLVNRREAKYFRVGGLDTVSRFEIAREIRFCAHAGLANSAALAGFTKPEIAQNRASNCFCPSSNGFDEGSLPVIPL